MKREAPPTNSTHSPAQLLPELIFGLVGPLGARMDEFQGLLENGLSTLIGYETEPVRLSDQLKRFGPQIWTKVWEQFPVAGHDPSWWIYSGPSGAPPPEKVHEHIRRKAYMDAGRMVREDVRARDVLVRLAVTEILSKRKGDAPLTKVAFILRSLKHPAEVETLRKLYGPAFVLVGVHSTEDHRAKNLKNTLRRKTRLGAPARNAVATYLLNRDSYETDTGQRVRDTFYLADVFLSADLDDPLENQLERFLKLLFGSVEITPTKDEYGMFAAHAAATRSAALARQVGAAVATPDGEIVALGCNEVPKPGGGLVFEDSEWTELRDLNRPTRRDTGQETKEDLLREILTGWGLEDSTDRRQLLKGARVFDLIEFYREVHAEAAALLDAARRGVSVRGCTIYVTTFPCHDCAKHILAAGISRIVYVEPYPKSRALEFFPRAIKPAGTKTPEDSWGCPPVTQEPFVGVGPNLYRTLFTVSERKTKDGMVLKWKPALKWPTYPAAYLQAEKRTLQDIWTHLEPLLQIN